MCVCVLKKPALLQPGGVGERNATVKIKPHFSKAVAGLTAARSQAGYGFRKMRLYFHGCVQTQP